MICPPHAPTTRPTLAKSPRRCSSTRSRAVVEPPRAREGRARRSAPRNAAGGHGSPPAADAPAARAPLAEALHRLGAAAARARAARAAGRFAARGSRDPTRPATAVSNAHRHARRTRRRGPASASAASSAARPTPAPQASPLHTHAATTHTHAGGHARLHDRRRVPETPGPDDVGRRREPQPRAAAEAVRLEGAARGRDDAAVSNGPPRGGRRSPRLGLLLRRASGARPTLRPIAPLWNGCRRRTERLAVPADRTRTALLAGPVDEPPRGSVRGRGRRRRSPTRGRSRSAGGERGSACWSSATGLAGVHVTAFGARGTSSSSRLTASSSAVGEASRRRRM